MAVSLRAILLTGLTGLVLLAGFAGWLGHGTTLLLAAAENGLSWCF